MVAGARHSRLGRVDLSRIRDVSERLGVSALALDSGAPTEAWLALALQDMLGGGRVAAYRPAQDADGRWGLGERATTDDTFFASYDAGLAQCPVPFCYDPLRPKAAQTQRAHYLHELHTHGPEETCVVEDLWPRIGIRGHDQLRVLICDGPTLLAWIGVVREEPFGQREQAMLTALMPSLRRALALRRRLLDGGLAIAGLAKALEAIGAPAFIVRSDGVVEHANEVGTAFADRRRAEITDKLRNAVTGDGSASFVAALAAPGLPARFLVVFREASDALSQRLLVASRLWCTTAAELSVLRWLVTGDANKEIALKLRRSEVSIERHVTSLLRKAKCDGRARLVAAFFNMR